jgi:hydrogenase nickel incorporation protein HypB
MCANCGCGESEVTITNVETGAHIHLDSHGHEHEHRHAHAHTHEHSHAAGLAHTHEHSHGKIIELERSVLSKNDRLAEQNRGWLAGRGVRAVNIMSSPGAGKTTLLERTIRELGKELGICVIEGDQATMRDGERIRAAGSTVIQINTGAGCHLDAAMVGRALRQLDPPSHSMVLIENVGNLVCPALFDLGEESKALVASVTEGDDKPAKYPHMFHGADIIILNKMDLLPHVTFDVSAFERGVRELNPDAQIFPLSATRGDGLDAWFQWLRSGTGKHAG